MSKKPTKTIKWKSGPPPFVGWWNASTRQTQISWRWWNGSHWSVPCCPADKEVGSFAEIPSKALRRCIEWNDRWPEGARVPRIDPRPINGALKKMKVGQWYSLKQLRAIK